MLLGLTLPEPLAHGTKPTRARYVLTGGGLQMPTARQPRKLAAGVPGIVVKILHQLTGLMMLVSCVNGTLTTSPLVVLSGSIIQVSVPHKVN